jgi:hypothetical protein
MNDEACAKEVTRLITCRKIPQVILSAGHAKIHGKSDNFPDQRYTMAMMQREQLINLGVSSRLIRIVREVWGTKAELETIQKEIVASESVGKIIDEVVLQTSWWHAPRTMRIARRIISRPVRIIETADLTAGSKDLLEEAAKIVAEEIRMRIPMFGTLLRWFRGRD